MFNSGKHGQGTSESEDTNRDIFARDNRMAVFVMFCKTQEANPAGRC